MRVLHWGFALLLIVSLVRELGPATGLAVGFLGVCVGLGIRAAIEYPRKT